jgi:hypothetical protein
MANRADKTVKPSALDLLAAPEWDGQSKLTFSPLHITKRDAGFGDFLILHGTNDTEGAENPLVAVKVVGAVLLNNFVTLADGSPKNLIGRQFTILPAGTKNSRQTRDKDGNPAEYKNYVVVEGDGTEAPTVDDLTF